MVRWLTIAAVCATTTLLLAKQPAAPADPTNSANPANPANLLVSRQLLESQRLSVGDVIFLSSERSGANPRPFRIVGQYEPIPDPMRLGAARHEVHLHLPDLIELTGAASPEDRESVDAINVKLANAADAQSFARDLSTRLPGLTIRSTTADDQRAAPFIVLERFHLAIAIVTVFASSIFLLALMLMLVDERRDTVGVLRLIGYRRERILLYVFAEGVVLAATGAVVGLVLAALFQGGINRFFQWRYDTALVFVRVTPRIALRSAAMAVPLGVAAAVASSWTLIRREVFSVTRR